VDAEDRMWSVRDAALLYLYRAAVDSTSVKFVSPDSLSEAVNWRAKPISGDEINKALDYLKDKGFIDGHRISNGQLIAPSITADGQDLAAAGTSVRPTRGEPLPANPSGGDVYITATGSNVSVGGLNFSQTFSQNENSSDVIAQVVAVLREFAEHNPEQAAPAEGLAGQIETEAGSANPNTSKLVLMLTLITGVLGTAFSSELGQRVVQSAFDAISALTAS
jgi:hypothetical protein